jgi:uncharacterized membrane protein
MRSCAEHLAAKLALAFLALSIVPNFASACPSCATSEEVWAALQAQGAMPLVVILLAFTVVGMLILAATRLVLEGRMLLGATMLFGAGLGAFLDGIVLHQLLQWHQMLSSVLFPGDLVSSKVNMFWDGVFHLFAWLTAAAGFVLFAIGARSVHVRLVRRSLVGGASVGWGLFNLVEGIVDHHLLGLHHVHPGADQLSWDLAFLVFGALLVIAGGAAIAAELPLRRLHRRS